METRFVDRRITYDGTQLHAHWILREIGLEGDAMVAFRGPCDVARDEIADLADVDGPGIAGAEMLHFVEERFRDETLDAAIVRQRLLTCIAAEVLAELGAKQPIRRRGDDLFVGDGKLSISIATRSTVSSLLHFAVNVVNDGTPVATASLQDLEIDPRGFAERVLERVRNEYETMRIARAKVRARGETP